MQQSDNQATPSTLPAGHIVAGRYRLVRPLGYGGFGMVYEAEVAGAHHRIALKLLHPRLAEQPTARGRFRREAQLIQRVQHPNVVQLLDFGEHDDGRNFMALELLEGQSLRQLLERVGRLTVYQVAAISDQVLGALEAAHRLGVVHRDIKPGNIFLCSNPPGSLKVLDFGIAKAVAGDAPATKLTETGDLLGTPHYMAPEQVRGANDLDGRVDIYALGMLMAEMFCGHRLIVADTAIEVLMEHVAHTPIALPTSLSESRLGPIVRRALEKNREARFPSALAMQEALRLAMQAGAQTMQAGAQTMQAGAQSVPFPASPARSHGSEPRSAMHERGRARVPQGGDQTVQVSRRTLRGLVGVALLLIGASAGVAYDYAQRRARAANSQAPETTTAAQSAPAAPGRATTGATDARRAELGRLGLAFEQEVIANIVDNGCQHRDRVVGGSAQIYAVNMVVTCRGGRPPFSLIVYFSDEATIDGMVNNQVINDRVAMTRRKRAALMVANPVPHLAKEWIARLMP